MKRTYVALLLALLGNGCATDSSEEVLLGGWGGTGLGISASAGSVTIDLPCGAQGSLAEPVQLGEDGTFEFEITVQHFYGDFEAYVSGRAAGHLLVVDVASYERTSPHVLRSGATPDFKDYVCLGEDR